MLSSRVLCNCGGNLRCQPLLPGVDSANRLQQLFPQRTLQQVSLCTRFQRPHDLNVAYIRREDDDSRLREFLPNRGDLRAAAAARQREGPAGVLYKLNAVPCPALHLAHQTVGCVRPRGSLRGRRRHEQQVHYRSAIAVTCSAGGASREDPPNMREAPIRTARPSPRRASMNGSTSYP